jgi:flagellum-specific peptidoglycan hydrolase FlgJ
MRDLVFSVVVVLGVLAVMQVSVDGAWAAKKPHHEKQEKKEKKEKKEDKAKKEEKGEKDKKEEKDKRETNNCPGWLSKGCSPGACRCPVGPEKEKKPQKAEEKEKKPQEAEQKEKKPQKTEPGRRTQTRKGAEPARRTRSSSGPLSSFVIRYDKGADVLDRRPQIECMLL